MNIAMGKGTRTRAARVSSVSRIAQLNKKEASAQRVVRILCICMLLITVLTLLVQLWSLMTIEANLQAERYTAQETATLNRLLPVGWLGVIVMAGGAAAASVLLLRKKWKPSLIGTALTVVAGVLLVLFALSLGDIFAYDALKDRGLMFGDLVLRHFTVLLTPILSIIASLFGRRAAKKYALAQMMADMCEEEPTISFDENAQEEN